MNTRDVFTGGMHRMQGERTSPQEVLGDGDAARRPPAR